MQEALQRGRIEFPLEPTVHLLHLGARTVVSMVHSQLLLLVFKEKSEYT